MVSQTPDFMDSTSATFKQLCKKPMPYWLKDTLAGRLEQGKITHQHVRFYSDAIAAALGHCNLELHRACNLSASHAWQNAAVPDRKTYMRDALELARCITLMGTRYPGLLANIDTIIAADAANSTYNRHTSEALTWMREAITAFTAQPDTANTRFSDLAPHLNDQAAYAAAAQKLIEAHRAEKPTAIATNVISLTTVHARRTEAQSMLNLFAQLYREAAPLHKVIADMEMDLEILPATGTKDDDDLDIGLIPFVPEETAIKKILGCDVMFERGFYYVDYKPPFLARFRKPTHVVAPETLKTLRKTLDDARYKLPLKTRKLSRLFDGLREKTPSINTINTEDGHLDMRGLATIITSPFAEKSYLQTTTEPVHNAAVTFMIDNSGSMTDNGRHKTATLAVDVIAEALESCGIKTEILSFAGTSIDEDKIPPIIKSRMDATEAAEQDLDLDLFSIFLDRNMCADLVICKSHDEKWKKARMNMGVNVSIAPWAGTPEGEALLFAFRRIIQRPEAKKIVIVIGDGEANNMSLLKSVIADIAKMPHVKLAAIKIGVTDESPYPTNIRIDHMEDLSYNIINFLVAQLQPQRKKMRPKALVAGLQRA